jgi:hypothetical protein
MPDNKNHVDRAQLAENDFVEWLGRKGAVIRRGSNNNRFDSNAANGLFVTIENPSKVKLSQQSDWQGNFNPDDRLIYTSSDEPRPIGILLSQPVKGIGFQIQINMFDQNGNPLPFDGILRAYGDINDKDNTELGYCCFTGSSDSVPGNARFLGVVDPAASITYVEIETRLTDNERNQSFAINKLLLEV